jgi:hypothetical protein
LEIWFNIFKSFTP